MSVMPKYKCCRHCRDGWKPNGFLVHHKDTADNHVQACVQENCLNEVVMEVAA
jgi:hypothetical protein